MEHFKSKDVFYKKLAEELECSIDEVRSIFQRQVDFILEGPQGKNFIDAIPHEGSKVTVDDVVTQMLTDIQEKKIHPSQTSRRAWEKAAYAASRKEAWEILIRDAVPVSDEVSDEMIMKIYEQIAGENAVSVEEVQKEIAHAIEDAFNNPDATLDQRRFQASIPRAGCLPTPDELIRFLFSLFPTESWRREDEE